MCDSLQLKAGMTEKNDEAYSFEPSLRKLVGAERMHPLAQSGGNERSCHAFLRRLRRRNFGGRNSSRPYERTALMITAACAYYRVFLKVNLAKAAPFRSFLCENLCKHFTDVLHWRWVTHNPKIIAPINDNGHVTYLPLNDIEAAKAELAKGDVCAVIIEGIQGVGGIQFGKSERTSKACEEVDHPLFWMKYNPIRAWR